MNVMKNNFSQPFSDVGYHVNGWPVIQYFLVRNHVTQSSLAAYLQISPSAVSQIKQGMFLLNAEQLRNIVCFLKMDEDGVAAFYAQVFRGRLLVGDDRAKKGFAISVSSPDAVQAAVCQAAWLEAYEPVVESFGHYLTGLGIADAGALHIFWQAENAPGGVAGAGCVRLRYNDYPEPGDMVLLKCRGVPCRITRFLGWHRGGGVFSDLPDGAPEKRILFAGILWLHPADELQISDPAHPVPAGP